MAKHAGICRRGEAVCTVASTKTHHPTDRCKVHVHGKSPDARFFNKHADKASLAV